MCVVVVVWLCVCKCTYVCICNQIKCFLRTMKLLPLQKPLPRNYFIAVFVAVFVVVLFNIFAVIFY